MNRVGLVVWSPQQQSPRDGTMNILNINYISVFQLIALNIFYKQHIKTYVLSKTLKISPTCFGHLATIFREIQYLSLFQLLNYRCSSMPAAMCVLGPVLSFDHRKHVGEIFRVLDNTYVLMCCL